MLWPYFLNMYLSQAEHTWICSSILDAILDAISERNPSERDEKGERGVEGNKRERAVYMCGLLPFLYKITYMCTNIDTHVMEILV